MMTSASHSYPNSRNIIIRYYTQERIMVSQVSPLSTTLEELLPVVGTSDTRKKFAIKKFYGPTKINNNYFQKKKFKNFYKKNSGKEIFKMKPLRRKKN